MKDNTDRRTSLLNSVGKSPSSDLAQAAQAAQASAERAAHVGWLAQQTAYGAAQAVVEPDLENMKAWNDLVSLVNEVDRAADSCRAVADRAAQAAQEAHSASSRAAQAAQEARADQASEAAEAAQKAAFKAADAAREVSAARTALAVQSVWVARATFKAEEDVANASWKARVALVRAGEAFKEAREAQSTLTLTEAAEAAKEARKAAAQAVQEARIASDRVGQEAREAADRAAQAGREALKNADLVDRVAQVSLGAVDRAADLLDNAEIALETIDRVVQAIRELQEVWEARVVVRKVHADPVSHN